MSIFLDYIAKAREIFTGNRQRINALSNQLDTTNETITQLQAEKANLENRLSGLQDAEQQIADLTQENETLKSGRDSFIALVEEFDPVNVKDLSGVSLTVPEEETQKLEPEEEAPSE